MQRRDGGHRREHHFQGTGTARHTLSISENVHCTEHRKSVSDGLRLPIDVCRITANGDVQMKTSDTGKTRSNGATGAVGASVPLRRVRRFGAALALAGSAALLGACAGTPPPTEQLALARSAVANAVTAGGTEHAPVEMRAAQEKLSGAEKAISAKENDQARRLADEAVVDARLAERKALATKARQTLEQAQEGIRVLQQEMMNQTP
jgi:hypothetical protein